MNETKRSVGERNRIDNEVNKEKYYYQPKWSTLRLSWVLVNLRNQISTRNTQKSISTKPDLTQKQKERIGKLVNQITNIVEE